MKIVFIFNDAGKYRSKLWKKKFFFFLVFIHRCFVLVSWVIKLHIMIQWFINMSKKYYFNIFLNKKILYKSKFIIPTTQSEAQHILGKTLFGNTVQVP